MSRLIEARTAEDIVAAVLAAVWENSGGDGDPPELTPEELGEWIPECPETARPEAGRRLRTLWPDLIPEADLEWRRLGGELWVVATGFPAFDFGGEVSAVAVAELADGHRKWADMEARPPHPLAPLVKAWIERPRQSAVWTGDRGSLADFDRPRHLPDATDYDPPEPQLALPGFEAGDTLRHWLLSWY